MKTRHGHLFYRWMARPHPLAEWGATCGTPSGGAIEAIVDALRQAF